MTVKTSLASKIPASGIDPHSETMWDDLGGLYPAVVLLEVSERTEPADTEGDRKVKLTVVQIEVPYTPASQEELREQLRRMYANRTGQGTLQFATGVAYANDQLDDEEPPEGVPA